MQRQLQDKILDYDVTKPPWDYGYQWHVHKRRFKVGDIVKCKDDIAYAYVDGIYKITGISSRGFRVSVIRIGVRNYFNDYAEWLDSFDINTEFIEYV